jgi:hypothetical protein
MGLSSKLIIPIPVGLGKQPGSLASIRALFPDHLQGVSREGKWIVSASAEVAEINDSSAQSLVVLEQANRIPHLKQFFEMVRSKLAEGGTLVGCVETVEARKARFLRRLPPGVSSIFYAADVFIHRVLSKLPWSRDIYLRVTGQRTRVLPKAEILGRLAACGFVIVSTSVVDELFVFVVKKSERPKIRLARTGALLLRLRRIGQDGRFLNVYKLRTMSLYSEYLQDYIFRTNNLERNGKFRDDFRVTQWGRFLRRTWLDELPMIYNWLKGDLKLLGVRPLSPHYYNLYDEALRRKRVQLKPGLIPPFYADMPVSFEEICESEERYIDAYLRSPGKTQCRYLWKILYNIVIKGARSS